MSGNMEMVIRFVFYLFILAGSWLVIMPLLMPSLKSRKTVKRYRDNQKEQGTKKKNKYYRHLELLISVTLNRKSPYIILTFLTLSAVLMVLALLFCLSAKQPLLTSLMVSFGFGISPYVFLLLRLYVIRVKSSYEAVGLVTELINQYKINWFNMIEAVDRTVPHLKNEPFTRRALFRMAIELKQYRNIEELDEIIQEFTYSIKTEWAILLANNMFLSIGYGDNVQVSLEDILEELKELKAITEKDKQFNTESFIMIKYLAPGLYIASVFSMFQFFGFNIKKFIAYQFQNPQGFQFFVFTMLFILINAIVYYFVKKPKNDF